MQERTSVKTPDGDMRAYVSRPDGPVLGAVVVLQEIFGINADMRETCDWLADAGFVALAPDLFWRQESGVDMTDRTEAEWQHGFALYQAYDRQKGIDDVVCAMDTARSLAESIAGQGMRVGVMGFCLGGLMTFRTAALEGADAAVAYYGGETEKYTDEARSLRSPLMMHLAADDEYISPQAQEKIRNALKDHDEVEVHTYAGCRHAFARRGGAHQDELAGSLANERTLRFLLQHLPQIR